MKVRASFAVMVIVISQSGVAHFTFGNFATTSTTPEGIAAAKAKCEAAKKEYLDSVLDPTQQPAFVPNAPWSLRADCARKT